jgi:hypothetical protein
VRTETYYSATIDAAVEASVSEEQVEDLGEALADLGALGAAVSLRGASGLGATFTIYVPEYSDRAVVEAAERAVAAFKGAADGLGIAIVSIDEVDLMAGPFFERWLQQPPEGLAGVTEVAALLGVSRQRVAQLRERADFPAPIAELAAGPIWNRTSLTRFVEAWPRKPGRPSSRGAA